MHKHSPFTSELIPTPYLGASPDRARSAGYDERQTLIRWPMREACSIVKSGRSRGKRGGKPDFTFIPFADSAGIVVEEKIITLHGARAPYNASLIKSGDGFLLFFREELRRKKHHKKRFSKIGVARLDRNFTHIDPKCRFYALSARKHFLDPRAFSVDGNIYLAFYTVPDIGKDVWIAQVKENTLSLKNKLQLKTTTKAAERNWTFIVPESMKDNELSFIHTLSPRINGTVNLSTKVLSYTQPQVSKTSPLVSLWKWGRLSGGTPAILVDGMYVSLFHSYLTLPKRSYAMGACAFSKEPPHKLLAISPYPIITKRMYSSKLKGRNGPVGNRRWAKILDRVIFPCGIVLDKDMNGRDVFYVSCGENDLATRILTIDKERLLQSLVYEKN